MLRFSGSRNLQVAFFEDAGKAITSRRDRARSASSPGLLYSSNPHPEPEKGMLANPNLALLLEVEDGMMDKI